MTMKPKSLTELGAFINDIHGQVDGIMKAMKTTEHTTNLIRALHIGTDQYGNRTVGETYWPVVEKVKTQVKQGLEYEYAVALLRQIDLTVNHMETSRTFLPILAAKVSVDLVQTIFALKHEREKIAQSLVTGAGGTNVL